MFFFSLDEVILERLLNTGKVILQTLSSVCSTSQQNNVK
jgi:hypothetical protein